MFFHNFKYSLKTLFKNRVLLFWTFAFPIILGVFFQMAFSDIENSESLQVIPLAIVDNQAYQDETFFKDAMDALSDEDDEQQLFDLQVVSLEKAKQLLEDKKVTGYIEYQEEPSVTIASNGINETIITFTVDELIQTQQTVKDMMESMVKEEVEESMKKDPMHIDLDQIQDDVYKHVQSLIEDEEGVRLQDETSSHLSYTMIEFYTLIAMACLYGSMLGITSINQSLANMSSKGKRIAVSPAQKYKIIFSSVCASYIAQLIGIALLFLFTIYVLDVDYGNHMGYVVLLACVGCLAGLSLGIAVGCIFKCNENVKTGIVLAISMAGCFFSGMMGISMKYIVDQHVPIVNICNPANMITDGLYALYYYQTFERYWFNITSLLIFSSILIILSMVYLRRQTYDSI